MPVSESRPILEQIVDTVYDRLAVMTTGVYPNSRVTEVIRPVRTESFSPKSFQIILILGEQEEVEELSRPGNPPAIAFNALLNIYCHVMPSETDTTPFDEYCITFYADVVEALTDSGDAGWFYFGDLAIDANIGPMTALDADGVDGFLVPLNVTYRVSEWSPYQRR